MKKYIRIFSDGCVEFSSNTNLQITKVKINEKDERNFSFFKKEKLNTVSKSIYSKNYKNQYLF
jgi:hypothetical protein